MPEPADRTRFRRDRNDLDEQLTLPNATFVAFTGTPVELEDRDTHHVVGDYIGVYGIQTRGHGLMQAIARVDARR